MIMYINMFKYMNCDSHHWRMPLVFVVVTVVVSDRQTEVGSVPALFIWNVLVVISILML